jgi:hypothetical protein
MLQMSFGLHQVKTACKFEVKIDLTVQFQSDHEDVK